MVNSSAVVFCELVLAFFLGTLIGAVVLQLSCTVYNLFASVAGKRAGGPTAWPPGHALTSDSDWALYERIATLPRVPRPGFDRAVRIILLATLVNVPGTFIVFQLLRVAGQATGYALQGFWPVACVSLFLGILVLAGINTAMLPTTFGKGLLISLFSHFLAAILAAVIVLIVLTFKLPVPILNQLGFSLTG